MGGRLEHEIRLLPQVLSCSFSKDDYVVVLIDPSADPHSIQRAVEKILLEAGSQATVRVIGPSEPVQAAATRLVSPLVATATVATVAAIGVGALVGGLSAADHPREHAPAAKHPVPGAGFAPTDSLDVLRGIQVSAAGLLTQLQAPAEVPDHTLRVLPVSHGTSVEAVSLIRAIPPVHSAQTPAPEQDLDDSGPHRHADHGRHHGNGPRSWSHSRLLRAIDDGKGPRG